MARKVCDVNWKVTGSHKTWPENSPNIIWANKQSSAADNFQMSDSWGRNLSKVSDFYLKVLSYAGMTAAAHRITDVLSLLAGLTVWLKQSNLMDWNSIRQWFGHTCAERKKRSWVDPKKTSVCFFIWLTGRLSKDVSIGGQILHMWKNWIFNLFTFQSQKGAKPSSHLDGVRRGWSFVSANNAYYPNLPQPPTT